jgi:hypothetical protein
MWLGAGIVVLLYLVVTLFCTAHGYFTPDAGAYHMMARNFSGTGSFFLDNGYVETGSPMMQVGLTRPHGGRLVAQYPELWTVLAALFYPWKGYGVFFYLNALAFPVVLALTGHLAWRLQATRASVFLSVFLLALGSFAGVWSQSSYPHIFSMMLTLGACSLLLEAGVREGVWRRVLLVGCGALLGINLGVRSDAILGFTVIASVFLFMKSFRWTESFWVVGGIVPWLVLLSWINHTKFGSFSPLTYGETHHVHNSTGTFRVVGMVGFAALVLFCCGFHSQGKKRWICHGLWMVLVVSWLFVADVPTGFAPNPAEGIFQILVDLRIRPVVVEGGLERSVGGAVLCLGEVKKALLQSCPWVGVVLCSIPCLFRGGAQGARAAVLWSLPAASVLFFGSMAWHGSLSLNMRYLTPALPFLAILAAGQLVSWWPDKHWRPWLLLTGMGVLCLIPLFLKVARSVPGQEWWFLNGSLFLAASVVIAALARRSYPRMILPLFFTAVAWSGGVAWARDYMLMNLSHAGSAAYSRELGRDIPGKSLVLASIPPYGVFDPERKIWLGRPGFGDKEDGTSLFAWAEREGFSVYLIERKAAETEMQFPESIYGRRLMRKLPEEGEPIFRMFKLEKSTLP